MSFIPQFLFNSFSNELVKLAAKRAISYGQPNVGPKKPISAQVPDPSSNRIAVARYMGNPGKTPGTNPGKTFGTEATTSGFRHSTEIGRSGTSANPAPLPPSVSA